jgi:hypothetical protein
VTCSSNDPLQHALLSCLLCTSPVHSSCCKPSTGHSGFLEVWPVRAHVLSCGGNDTRSALLFVQVCNWLPRLVCHSNCNTLLILLVLGGHRQILRVGDTCTMETLKMLDITSCATSAGTTHIMVHSSRSLRQTSAVVRASSDTSVHEITACIRKTSNKVMATTVLKVGWKRTRVFKGVSALQVSGFRREPCVVQVPAKEAIVVPHQLPHKFW